MAISEASVRAALEKFVDPYLRQTLQQAQAVRAVELDADRVLAKIELGYPTIGYTHTLQSALQRHLAAAGLGVELTLELASHIVPHAVQRNLKPLAGVKNIVAVASGKGGVGKSTVAVNLALAWAAAGAQVGILDADIYGPSQPLMLGLVGQHPSSPDGKHIRPLQAHGLAAMSIGFLVDPAQAVVWRGPMVTQALSQLLTDTDWGELDYLVVDMPPGTGDIQLTLSQRVPVAGAIIVTTPLSLAIASGLLSSCAVSSRSRWQLTQLTFTTTLSCGSLVMLVWHSTHWRCPCTLPRKRSVSTFGGLPGSGLRAGSNPSWPWQPRQVSFLSAGLT